LRDDLAELGLARSEDMFETEDHVAYVFEVMRFLIAGDDVAVSNLTRQQAFFTQHVQSWLPAMCQTLQSQHPMEEDAYGIPKPKDTEVIVPTLLFVPCVGYGPGGYRLGYGGGFYDRTLATLQPKPFTVGLGFTQGFVDDLEPEAHDEPLDAILNDNGVVWPI